MKVYFVRHGESVGNKEGWPAGQLDPELTDVGEGQAQLTAAKIKEKGITPKTIISSDQSRAQKTAEIIAKGIGYEADEIKHTELLREWNIGSYAGQSKEKFLAASLEEVVDAGGESMADIRSRALALIELIVQTDSPVMLVGHNGFTKALRMFFDPDFNEVEAFRDMPNHENGELYEFKLLKEANDG